MQVKPHEKFYADVPYLANWAQELMDSREPDFRILNSDGASYMDRWWVIPRNYCQNLYLHKLWLSDDERAMHDHPWDNASFILQGELTELTPEGEFHRKAGDIIHRLATAAHRLVITGEPVISLFSTGPMIREWGFHCPQGWRRWQDFVELNPDATTSHVGRGCD